jgi:hypothetical protein
MDEARGFRSLPLVSAVLAAVTALYLSSAVHQTQAQNSEDSNSKSAAALKQWYESNSVDWGATQRFDSSAFDECRLMDMECPPKQTQPIVIPPFTPCAIADSCGPGVGRDSGVLSVPLMQQMLQR